jgi:molybdate/tungstate transport system substrate-binding protein
MKKLTRERVVPIIKFVEFLLGPQGRAVMQEHGLDIVRPSVVGDASKIPTQIRSEIDAAK